MTADLAIAAGDLVKTYPGGRPGAARASASPCPAGTVFGLLGPNGAGKSTTVKILTTLARADARHRAASPAIDVARAAGRGAAGDRRASSRSTGVDPEATGRENLAAAGPAVRAARPARCGPRADELLDRFGLADAAGRLARHLVRRHAAQARRRAWAWCTARRCCSWTSRPPASTRRPAPTMWAEIARLAARGRADRPAHHALPGGGRPAGRPARHRRPRPRSSPTARPEQLKSELRGDASWSSSADAGATRRAPLRRCRASARSRVGRPDAAGPGRRRRPRRAGGAGRAGGGRAGAGRR